MALPNTSWKTQWNRLTMSTRSALDYGPGTTGKQLTAEGVYSDGGSQPTSGSKVITAGKGYYEIAVVYPANYPGISAGISDGEQFPPYTVPGSANNRAVSFHSNGNIYRNGSIAGNYGGSVWENIPNVIQVIGVAIDANLGLIWFRLNGAWVYGDPATGTGGLLTYMAGNYAPLFSSTATDTLGTLRRYLSEFRDPPPTGFLAWDNDDIAWDIGNSSQNSRISNDGLTASALYGWGSQPVLVNKTAPALSYFEATYVTAGSSSVAGPGFCTRAGAVNYNRFGRESVSGFLWRNDGYLQFNGNAFGEPYIGGFAVGANLGLAINAAGRVWCRLNGTWLNGDPVAGTGGHSSNLLPGQLYAAICTEGEPFFTGTFKASAFTYPPPTGFTAYDLAVAAPAAKPFGRAFLIY